MDVPFIVKNVRNDTLIPHDYDDKLYVYKINNHTYWSNVLLKLDDLEFQHTNKQNVCKQKRQGGYNVHIVIERFIETVESGCYVILTK